MDSTNFQHHHLQHQQQRQQQQHEQQQQQQHEQQQQQHEQQQRQLEEAQFVGCSSLNNNPSAAAAAAAYHAASTSLDWNPGFLSAPSRTSSNGFSNKLYDNEFHTTNGDHSRLPDNTPIVDNDARNFSYPTTSNLPKIEEDMLSSFPSFGGGLIHNIGMENHGCWFNNNNSGFVSASTTGAQYGTLLDHKNHHQLSPYNNNWSTNGNGFPSTSLLNQLGLVASSPNSTTTSISSSPRLGLNLQATDFFGNNAGLGSQNRPLYDSGSCVGDEVVSPFAGKIMSNNKQASSMMSNGVIGTKRAAGNCSSDQHPKSSTSNHTSATNKKSQLKVSCPPFKVRKEKLGDRIASLHQLVSPFGKTDTASVLTEAIGYIQFLQDQIHTLCMPHAKPPRNKPCSRPFQVGAGGEDDGKEDARIDIRRRGLCLVPLSWTSYVTPTQMDTSNLAYF